MYFDAEENKDHIVVGLQSYLLQSYRTTELHNDRYGTAELSMPSFMKSHRLQLFAFITLVVEVLIGMCPAWVDVRAQDIPRTEHGRIVRYSQFPSAFVRARNIDIWLPEQYDSTQRYDVLYMHDGQMLYDASTTWNKQAWDIDDTASALIGRGECRPFIVVGIWNGGDTRHPEYFPQKPYAMLSPAQRDTVSAQLREAGRTMSSFTPVSDNYLRFLVEELKPFIDSTYAVQRGHDHTFIAGSSMGGLISLYALCEYPEVFGGAACISTHWIGSFAPQNNPIPEVFFTYMKRHLPDPATHKLYFDCGDKTLDAFYPLLQRRADSIMRNNYYTSSSWKTEYIKGADHSETSWSKRLALPLRFLLGR